MIKSLRVLSSGSFLLNLFTDTNGQDLNFPGCSLWPGCLEILASFADDDWYLCHVTLLAPEEDLLSWAMYPYPYLARVDPDAHKGTLVYQLVARYSGHENTTAGIAYTLIAGRASLKKG